MAVVLKNADRGDVMDAGQMDLTGRAHDLLQSDRLRKAYLGIE